MKIRSKSRILGVTLAFLFLSCSGSKNSKESVDPALNVLQPKAAIEVCTDTSGAFFWTVKGKASTIYLFGTIHVGKPDFYPLPPKVEKALDSSQYLVLELNPRSDSFLNNGLGMVTYGLYQAGHGLKEDLPDSLYKKLEFHLEQLGMPLEKLSQFKPWMVSVTLAQLQLSALGYDPKQGVEMYLLDQWPDSMEVLELETVESQMKVMADSIDGVDFLDYSLQSMDSIPEKLEELIIAWKCGNEEVVKRILFNEKFAGSSSFEELNEKLIINRNIRMAEKIIQFLEKGEGNYFVAVGAGHYIGDKSIVKLLEKAGYPAN